MLWVVFQTQILPSVNLLIEVCSLFVSYYTLKFIVPKENSVNEAGQKLFNKRQSLLGKKDWLFFNVDELCSQNRS